MEKFLSFLKKNMWNIIAIAIGIVMFVVDIVTKQVIVKYFATHEDPIVLIPNFLQINYVINTAAAFGFGIGNELVNRIVYCVIAFLAVGAIFFFFFWKNSKFKMVKIAMMLIASGAIGNLVDRIFYSPEFLHSASNGVVDWIDFCGIWAFVFNIADSCVVIGAIMLIVWLIIEEVKDAKAKRKQEIASNDGVVLSAEERTRMDQAEDNRVNELEEKVFEESQKNKDNQ